MGLCLFVVTQELVNKLCRCPRADCNLCRVDQIYLNSPRTKEDFALTTRIDTYLHNGKQPRSQGLSSLPPLVVARINDQGRQRREILGTRLNGKLFHFLVRFAY